MTDFETFSLSVAGKIRALAKRAVRSDAIDPALYEKYDVKRGLRDINGNGVVAGLTEISDIVSYQKKNGVKTPCRGQLFYRGYNVEEIVNGFISSNRFGFEETAFLLLFGALPDRDELESFTGILSGFRTLPKGFVRDIIMKAPSADMMNVLARSVLTLYSYDEHADDTSIPNVLRQSLQLIALFPMLAVYGYQAFHHYLSGGSLIIHKPVPEYSTAQNLLHILRLDNKFSELEAKILDLCLVLHAEHGGGNNSSFTTHVVSSSGTDTYSAICAALGSLKGPRHGGANVRVVRMFDDMKRNLPDRSDASVSDYLAKLLDKQAFDRAGLIYGMGHAVYSLSDPRCELMKRFVGDLAEQNGFVEDFELYQKVERLAPQIIAEKRKIYKGVSANVDFYSGLVYSMLKLPPELYTPIFAVARIVGWSAHRIEEISNNGKIIRPGYQWVGSKHAYKPLEDR